MFFEFIAKKDLITHIALDSNLRTFLPQMFPRLGNRVIFFATVGAYVLLLKANIQQVIEEFKNCELFIIFLSSLLITFFPTRMREHIFFKLFNHHF